MSKRASPISSLQRSAVYFLLWPASVSDAFNIIAKHFALTADQADGQWSSMRGVVLELCAAVHYRCALTFGRFPFKLLWLASADRTDSEKRQVGLEFLRANA
eukprot:16452126-Heterocapsa_arctica.AAC.1